MARIRLQFPCEETGTTQGGKFYWALNYTGLEGNEDSAFSGFKKNVTIILKCWRPCSHQWVFETQIYSISWTCFHGSYEEELMTDNRLTRLICVLCTHCAAGKGHSLVVGLDWSPTSTEWGPTPAHRTPSFCFLLYDRWRGNRETTVQISTIVDLKLFCNFTF